MKRYLWSRGYIDRFWRQSVVCLGLTLTGAGCSEVDVDRDDELGVDGAASVDDRELVIVGDDAGDSSDQAGVATGGSPPPAKSEAASGSAIAYDAEGEFTVQIAIHPNAREAGKMVRKLSDQGYPAYAIARPDGNGVRVRIGYFGNRDDAVRFGRRFQQDTGADYWVDRRTNEMF